MPNIRDVARSAEVSVGTVSNFLTGTRFVSPDTATRIEEAIRELGYRPNALARGLRRQRTSTIGLVLPDSSNPYFAEIAWHIEQAAVASGFSIMLCNTDSQAALEASAVELLLEMRVDGVVLVPGSDKTKVTDRIISSGTPLVLLSRDVPGVEADAVIVDNEQGGKLAANHLVRLGHQLIGYVGRESTVSPSLGRLRGFRQGLAEAGVDLLGENVLSALSSAEDGYWAAMTLLRRNPAITAIFSYNDIMALGAIRAAADLDRPIPDSLSVIGFDDISLSKLSVPRLTTIGQSMVEMGKLPVDVIAKHLANRDVPGQRYVLPVHLVERETTGPAPSVGGIGN